MHLPQGGGPSIVHEAGWVISHNGVGIGDATGEGAFGFLVGLAIAGIGENSMAIRRIISAIISVPELKLMCVAISQRTALVK